MQDTEGVLEVIPEGYGFLRSAKRNFLASPDDIYVPAGLIRKNGLKTGTMVAGKVAPPRKPGQRPSLAVLGTADGLEPEAYGHLEPFKHLTTIDPTQWLRLEGENGDPTLRIIDLLCPIGKGQRCLIVAPPRTGKTVMLQRIGNAVNENFPEIKVFVLLINERPEEVTEMRRSIRGEVISSSLDELAPQHIKIAEMTLARAQRLVEAGEDVLVLIDSLTRMARAYNMEIESSGRTLSGGVDSRALEKPKVHFGAARKVEDGGSLTIVATALIAAPIGIDVANQIGANPDAFLMAVAVAASCAFLTPIGHKNNTIIMGPGGYKFGDYWRLGLPLEILVIVVSVPMIMVVWPL